MTGARGCFGTRSGVRAVTVGLRGFFEYCWIELTKGCSISTGSRSGSEQIPPIVDASLEPGLGAARDGSGTKGYGLNSGCSGAISSFPLPCHVGRLLGAHETRSEFLDPDHSGRRLLFGLSGSRSSIPVRVVI